MIYDPENRKRHVVKNGVPDVAKHNYKKMKQEVNDRTVTKIHHFFATFATCPPILSCA